jgi:homoserine O-acetyltransferase/O-succinyltransferase
VKEQSVGQVKSHTFTFAEHPHELPLESGERLGPIDLVYETYGELNADRSNAILILHALSADAHAAGYHQNDEKPGWWEPMIGPGKAIDTDKYFVICSNVIGGCKGSTGPSSINPSTQQPYGISFPVISIADMVKAQQHLIDFLKIEKLLCVIGGSMGGMQVLQWVSSYPERIKSAIPIATTLHHSPQQIAFNEVGRQSIMADPSWNHGNYYGKTPPIRGLAIARMIGHITYMSENSMEQKFSRRLKSPRYTFKLHEEFEVEGYLRYVGDSFVKRFDANSYLYITKALDYFDMSDEKLIKNAEASNVRFLVIAFKSDWLYPSYQSQEIVRELKKNHAHVTYCEVGSNYGHDAFLVEVKEQARLVKHFLAKVASK